MNLRPETRVRLEYIGQVLIREFDTVPAVVVLSEVDTATNALVARAKFDEFIPILAHRFAREQLRTRNELSAPIAA
jgi:hypothetical protein